jgi:hypothetical protein
LFTAKSRRQAEGWRPLAFRNIAMNQDQYSSAFPQENDEEALDRALEDTFPASDTLDLMPRRSSPEHS